MYSTAAAAAVSTAAHDTQQHAEQQDGRSQVLTAAAASELLLPVGCLPGVSAGCSGAGQRRRELSRGCGSAEALEQASHYCEACSNMRAHPAFGGTPIW